MAVDYKNKYLDLRSKFAKTTDRYYRAGYEEGLKKGEQQAMQQQQEMMQQQQAMEAGVDPETGMPIEGAVDENGMPIEGEMPQEGMEEEMGEEEGSELDQHINELEGLVQKGEKPKVLDMRKAVNALVSLRKTQKNQLNNNHKEVVVSKQKNLVDNILQKWEKETTSKSVVENLEEIIASEGIKLD